MSLLSYGHELGYMLFNAGVRIKVQNDAGNRGASLAKGIMTPAATQELQRAQARSGSVSSMRMRNGG